jgi:hypothetical protein
MQDEASAATTSPGEVTQLAEAYEAAAREWGAEGAKKLDKELRELAKIEKHYRRSLERALEKEGAEAEAMKRDLQKVTEERDPEAAQRKAEEVRSRHGELMKRAMARSGIDRKDARGKLLSAIGHGIPRSDAPAGETRSAALAADVELVETESLGFSLITRPPSPAPSPPGTVVALRPPYNLRSVSTEDSKYAWTHTDVGQFYACSLCLAAGSFQTLASVGSTFTVDPSVRRIRLEATAETVYETLAAGPIYASAEAKVNLILRDGSREVASDRLSLARSIVVVLWVSGASGRNIVKLACEFERRPGIQASYAAIVEGETWAGGGGASSRASVLASIKDFKAIMGT